MDRLAIDSLLDLDFYKLTMGQFIYFNHPNIPVTYSLINRKPEQRLADRFSVSKLQEQLDHIRTLRFESADLDYLQSLLGNRTHEPLFASDYLEYLRGELELPKVNVFMDPSTNDIGVNVTGPWIDTVLWETLIMSTILELYFDQDNTPGRQDEGIKRLDRKLTLLEKSEVPLSCITDFGTRRRFQRSWQGIVLDRVNTFYGPLSTSNVYYSRAYGTTPIGTMAHELFMVLTALAELSSTGYNYAQVMTQAHDQIFNDWLNLYKGDLAIALPDTYNSFTTLDRMDYSTAYTYDGLRQDSGDPNEFADYMISWLYNWEIDSRNKVCVFSDTLDEAMIAGLYVKYKDLLIPKFGWGSTLMNDLGLPRLNIVVKATHVARHLPTVKLSDGAGKHLGPGDLVKKYQKVFGDQ